MSLIASSSPTDPAATFRRGIKSEIIEMGSTVIRIHHKDNGAIWFGPKAGFPPAYRFDAPVGEYRTMYAAAAIEGAFVETILHGNAEEQIVSRSYVEQRAWTEFATVRLFKLMKLYNDGLFWHGTDAGISALPSSSASLACRTARALLSASTTAAPASANARAVASPMPELAPVTRATWPRKSQAGFITFAPAYRPARAASSAG